MTKPAYILAGIPCGFGDTSGVQVGALLNYPSILGRAYNAQLEPGSVDYTKTGFEFNDVAVPSGWNASFHKDFEFFRYRISPATLNKWNVVGANSDGSAIARQLSGTSVNYFKVFSNGSISGGVAVGVNLSTLPNNTIIEVYIDGSLYKINKIVNGVSESVDSINISTLGIVGMAFGVLLNSGSILDKPTDLDVVFGKNGRMLSNTLSVSQRSSVNYASLGDSIAQGFGSTPGNVSFPDLLNLKLGFNELTKYSNLGSTVVFVDGNPQFISQVNFVPQNFDGLITVMIGVNDYTNDIPPGSSASAIAKNFGDLNINADFAEGFRYSIETLKNRCPSAEIIVIPPIYTSSAGTYSLETYRDIEKDICNFLGITVLDIFNTCGIDATTEAALMPDGLHPNDAGYDSITDAMVQTIISAT